jgi:hypothetical protein
MMGQDDVSRLLQGGRIQEVDPDPETAREEIATARRHIDAALKIVEEDSTLAFTGLYDAMRKAISAHMRTKGYRVTKGSGGHVKIGEYARAALDHLSIGDELDEFDTLRDLRNQSEYQAVFVRTEEVNDAAIHVRAIVEAIAGDLGL